MAGHSHWKTTKRTKEAEDKKRGAIFSKIAREIVIAVKEKDKNIESNPRLRAIIEKAKQHYQGHKLQKLFLPNFLEAVLLPLFLLPFQYYLLADYVAVSYTHLTLPTN